SREGTLTRNPKEPILIADDLVSAIELNRLTQKPVVWAVKAEDLEAVAENLRRFMPKHHIVIAATDAHMPKENSSKELAKETANSVNGRLIFPLFSKNDREQNIITLGEMLRQNNTKQVSKMLHKANLTISRLRVKGQKTKTYDN
ncbi:hypothetical protein, partial [Thalassospira sp. MCCC 1A01428]|uniref:hypothetical protein n=1 Tax=Thalassospira sp. MCCC 1A01428 TaxID=1470575 RepID=UPI000A228D01